MASESACLASDKKHPGGWEQSPPSIHYKAVQPLGSVNFPSFRRCIAYQYHIVISNAECVTTRLVLASRKLQPLALPHFRKQQDSHFGWCDSLRYSSTSILFRNPTATLVRVFICSTPVLALIKGTWFFEDLWIT
jgi:hypothetical protein